MTKTYTAGMASNVDSFASGSPPAGTPPKLFFYYMYVTYETLSGDPTFVISYVDANNRPKATENGPLTNVLTLEQRELFPKLPGNPTFSTVVRCEPLPGSLVRVQVTVPGQAAQAPEDFDFSAALNTGMAVLALRHDTPPRLCVAINTTFVAEPTATGDFSAPGPDEVKAILAHIHARLFEGPSAAWAGPDGTPQLPFTIDRPADSDEEKWAKAYSEMMLAMPYGTPSGLYGSAVTTTRFSDLDYYRKFIDPDDPGLAICAECQHLVTLAYLTRGIKSHDPKDPIPQFTAGDGSFGLVTSSKLGGFKIEPGEAVSIEKVITKLTPGSSYVYNGKNIPDPANPPDPPIYMGNKGAAHIGFVLRIDKDGKRVQTFDTGGLNVPNRATPLSSGIEDDPWVIGSSNIRGPAAGKFMGVCVLPEATDLAPSVEHMKKARPLGFARLVLVKRGAIKTGVSAADIIYMTPLMRMHYDGAPTPKSAFTYAAYLWSLREHPGSDEIAVLWSFTIPRGTLAKMMLHGSLTATGTNARELTVKELVEGAGLKVRKAVPRGSTGLGELDVKVQLPETLGCLDAMSQEDGTVTVVRRYDAHAGKDGLVPTKRPKTFDLHWGEASGSVTLSPADLDAMPYFKSG